MRIKPVRCVHPCEVRLVQATLPKNRTIRRLIVGSLANLAISLLITYTAQ